MAEIDVSAIRFVKYEKRVCFLILSTHPSKLIWIMHFQKFPSLKVILLCRVTGSGNFQKREVFDTETIYLIFKNVNELSERMLSRERERRLKLHFYVKCRLMCYTKAILKLEFHGIRISFEMENNGYRALAHAHAQHSNSLICLHLIKWNGGALSLSLSLPPLLVCHALFRSHSYANSFRAIEIVGDYAHTAQLNAILWAQTMYANILHTK